MTTCCHCLTIADGDALPDGWRSFTTHAGVVLTLCWRCRVAWVEDMMGSAFERLSNLEAAMMTVHDIMRTDVPERLPYNMAGKGVVQ